MSTPFDDNILRSLRRISRAVDLFSRELAKRHQLTGPQLVCLLALASGHADSPSTLANHAELSRATITGIIDRLEARGLVTRARGQSDRRRVRLILTEAGRAAAEVAPQPLHDRFAARLGQLGPETQAKIDAVLAQVVTMMEADAIDAAPLMTTGDATSPVEDVADFLSDD